MFTQAKALSINSDQEKRLVFLVKSGKTPQKLVFRAQIILMASEGVSNNQIAKTLKTSRPTVILWRNRFADKGVTGLYKDATRPGRKPKVSAEREKEIIETTLHKKPAGCTHWSTRSLAKSTGISATTIHRMWLKYNLQPHRVKTFKLSRDKSFVEKVRDVVGLYLNPPDKALVLSVDEKSQIQALDRTQPGLPMKRGRCGTMTHDYKRHGTTTLFAALSMLDGSVIGKCLPKHRAKEFIRFLKEIDKKTPADLDLHLIVDNYGTHKTPAVNTWLAKHPRFHFHFIPTSSSWLNMVERWFREITDKRLRRGIFKSVPDLIISIEDYLKAHNSDPKIFKWTKDADTILAKIDHCKEAFETLH